MRRSAASLCRSMNLCRSNADLHRSVQQPYATPMQQAYAAPMQQGLCRSNGPKPMPLQCRPMALQCCSPMLQCSSPMLRQCSRPMLRQCSRPMPLQCNAAGLRAAVQHAYAAPVDLCRRSNAAGLCMRQCSRPMLRQCSRSARYQQRTATSRQLQILMRGRFVQATTLGWRAEGELGQACRA